MSRRTPLPRSLVLAPVLTLASLTLACGSPQIVPRAAPGAKVASITVTSPAFAEGGRLPVDHTCDGKDVIPELVFSSPPEGTKSLVVIVDDPDAPNGTFTHMVAFNVSPSTRKIPSGPDLAGAGDARFGLNDFQVAHYSGPCPPHGEAHRYRFSVIALDTEVDLHEGAPKSKIEQAIDRHIIGEGTLTGYFGH